MFGLIIIVIVICPIVSCQSIDNINTLYTSLLTNYNMDVRPAVDQSNPVSVNISFNLISIQDLEEISGKLSINALVTLSWIEPRMTWNPSLNNFTFTIDIPSKSVWKPNLVLVNPTESFKMIGQDMNTWINIRYFYNGYSIFTPGDVFNAMCFINVKFYPFDVQRCELSFSPWGFTADELVLIPVTNLVGMDYFTENGEWELKAASMRVEAISFLSTNFSHCIITLEMERRPTFIVVNVVLPIMFMGFLNVLVFCLPVESGERVSFATTVLLSIAVFLTLVGDNMPKSSEPMSVLSFFLLTSLILSSLQCVMTIVNLRIYYTSSSKPIPKLVITLTKYLSSYHKPCDQESTNPKILEVIRSKLQGWATTGDTIVEEIQLDKDEVNDMCTTDRSEKMDHQGRDMDVEVTWMDVSSASDRAMLVFSLMWSITSALAFVIVGLTRHTPT